MLKYYLVCYSTLYNASIEDIMKYWEGDKAIQYLVERGLKVAR